MVFAAGPSLAGGVGVLGSADLVDEGVWAVLVDQVEGIGPGAEVEPLDEADGALRQQLPPVYRRVVENATGLGHLDLRGPHDLRHTYATWLEEAGIPMRVIDELMGHSGGARDGSPMGRTYRHTTPEMLARVVEAVEKRLAIALDVTQVWPDQSGEPDGNREAGG